MNQNETMGRRIAALRKERQMTQDALAQELGVSPQAVSKWEHDLSCPDIALLPKLARVLGVSTDYLLGNDTAHTPEQPEPEGSDDSGIHVEIDGGNRFDISFGPPRRYTFSGAAWLICVALLMLAGPVLKLGDSIGFWSACWISALIVWGIGGMLRRVRLSNVLTAVVGVYFALSGLDLFRLELGWEILFPVLILVLGISLLLESFGRKGRRHSLFRISGPGRGSTSEMHVKDGFLFCNGAFSERRYNVVTPLLKSGDVSVCFGEYTLDFSGVEAVTDNCRIEVSTSFGETELRIPGRFRVELVGNTSFGEAEIYGHPDPEPAGTIFIDGNVSFGELTVKYI